MYLYCTALYVPTLVMINRSKQDLIPALMVVCDHWIWGKVTIYNNIHCHTMTSDDLAVFQGLETTTSAI